MGFRGAFAQSEQTDKNVLLGVLVWEKRLPTFVRHVVPPDQLDIIRTHFVVNLL